MEWILILLAWFFGAILGWFFCALMCVSQRADDTITRQTRPTPPNPTAPPNPPDPHGKIPTEKKEPPYAAP